MGSGVGKGVVEANEAGFLGRRRTNNEAEYEGLVQGLIHLNDKKITNVIIHGDSELVVNQVLGSYTCKAPNLIEKCKFARENIGDRQIKHVPRGHNKLADKACNLVLDKALRAI